MKKLLSLLVLLVFVATGLWAQFYTTLPRDVRKNLAEAYYLVGRQYEQKGDTQKARNFQDMAYNIDPGLDPSNIQIQDLRSAAALILEGKAKLAAVPRTREEATQALLKSKFLRLVSAFLSKDTAGMLELMDGSLYFGDLGVEMTQAQIEGQLNSFFAGTVKSILIDVSSRGIIVVISTSRSVPVIANLPSLILTRILDNIGKV